MGSFGERLRREREMRGISLDEIAAATKIGTRSLKALEDEQFGKLPGGIFNKGFVRSYARFLGINEEQAVSDYLAAAGELEDKAPEINIEKLVAQHEGEKSPKPRSKELESINADSSGFPWMALIAIILIVVAASGGWKLYLRHKEQVETKRAAILAAEQAKQAAAQQSTPAIPAENAGQPAASTPDSAGQTPVIPPASTQQITATQANTANSSTTPLPDSADADRSFVVSVRAKGEAWVSITADGKKVMNGIMYPSNEKSVRAHDRIIFKTGNAGGVEIAFNGKVLEPIGRESEVRTVVITSNGSVQ